MSVSQLDTFYLLCSIRPTEWISRFPYSYITDGKIKFTEKVIELKATEGGTVLKSEVETEGGGKADRQADKQAGGLEIYLF
jgi:hypothetical protein